MVSKPYPTAIVLFRLRRIHRSLASPKPMAKRGSADFSFKYTSSFFIRLARNKTIS